MLAFHEAGHAVAAVARRRSVVRVTIRPDVAANAAGGCLLGDCRDLFALASSDEDTHVIRRARGRALRIMRDELAITLAGPLAMKRHYRHHPAKIDSDPGAADDFQHVRDIALKLALLERGKTSLSDATPRLRAEGRRLMERAVQDVRAFLAGRDTWQAVTRVADALQSRGTISGRSLRQLVRSSPHDAKTHASREVP